MDELTELTRYLNWLLREKIFWIFIAFHAIFSGAVSYALHGKSAVLLSLGDYLYVVEIITIALDFIIMALVTNKVREYLGFGKLAAPTAVVVYLKAFVKVSLPTLPIIAIVGLLFLFKTNSQYGFKLPIYFSAPLTAALTCWARLGESLAFARGNTDHLIGRTYRLMKMHFKHFLPAFLLVISTGLLPVLFWLAFGRPGDPDTQGYSMPLSFFLTLVVAVIVPYLLMKKIKEFASVSL